MSAGAGRRLGGCLAAAAVALAPSPAAAAVAPRLAGYGAWTLADLGLRPRVVTARETDARPFVAQAAAFRLPADARQGAGSWWRIRLHFRIRIAPGSPAGPVYVVASTNGRTCASIRFLVVRSGGHTTVVSDALGLVQGRQVRSGPSLMREVRFENFLQYRGIRPGLNRLELEVERTSRARVAEVVFYGDTALVRSRVGPAVLRPALFLPSASLHRGSPFDLRFRVVQTTGAPIARVTARVAADPALVRVHGPATEALRLRDGAAEGSFRLESLRQGRPRVVVTFAGAGVSATAYVDPRVGPPARGFPTAAVAGGIAGAAVAAAAAAAVLARRRARR